MSLDIPHRRFNPLTGEWVLVSPQRTQRPWLGQVEQRTPENLPSYDPNCYLCPGTSRAHGQRNPLYTGTFVFDNDFAALTPEVRAAPEPSTSPLFRYEPEPGVCRVVCFSPRHDLSLPRLSQAEAEAVVRTWIDQERDLGGRDFVRYVQIFENRGAGMGASNPHPHSQVWASGHIPNEPARELKAQADYRAVTGTCLLCDTLRAERSSAVGSRIVAANASCTALVPFWAIWPFETLVIFNRHVARLADLTADEVAGLADLLRGLTIRYDNLFETPFPYSMGFHPAPADGQDYPAWHLHAHFYPPLIRSASVRKFMVGYELLAMPQRDLTPETAAARLQALPTTHYAER